jgi:hypothetical protein
MTKAAITIFLIIWFIIGAIYGVKIHAPALIEFNRINPDVDYDYLTIDDILCLILLAMCYGTLGLFSSFLYYSIKYNDKKFIIRKRGK